VRAEDVPAPRAPCSSNAMRPALPPPAVPGPLLGASPRASGPAADGLCLVETGDGLAPWYSAQSLATDHCETWREAAGLFALAERDLEAGLLQEALHGASEALASFRAAGDGGAAADALRLMMHGWCREGKHSFVEAMAKEEGQLFAASGCALGEAKLKLSLAEVCLRKRDSDLGREATDLASEALASFRAHGAERWQGNALLTLASCHQRTRLGDRRQSLRLALSSAEQALKLFEAAGDTAGAAKALHNCAAAWMAMGEFEDGHLAAARALALFRELRDRRLEVMELQCMALWHLEGERPERALEHAEEAATICHSLHACSSLQVPALAILSRAHGAAGDVQAALQAARRALRHCDSSGDQEMEAIALDAMIGAHLLNDDFAAALKCARKALHGVWEGATCESECRMLCTLADLQLSMGLLDKARASLQSAMAFLEATGDARACAGLALQRVGVELAAGSYGAACQAVEEGRRLFRSVGCVRGEGLALLQVANVEFIHRDFGSASSWANQALSTFRSVGDIAGEAASLVVLSLVEAKGGSFEAALQAVRRAAGLLASERGERRRFAEALLLCAQMGLSFLQGSSDSSAALDVLVSGELEERRLEVLRDVGEALSLANELGDANLIATCQVVCSRALVLDGRAEESLAEVEEALELFRASGNALGEATALEAEAGAMLALDRRDEALRAAELARAMFEQVGDVEGTARADALVRRIAPSRAAAAPDLPPGWPPGWPPPPTGLDAAAGPESGPPGDRHPTAAVAAPAPQPRSRKEYGFIDLRGNVTLDVVLARLHQALDEGMGIDDDVEDDAPLLQAGLSSSNAIMMQRVLSTDFPSVRFPPTLVFDYPNLRAISEFVIANVAK